MEKSKKYTLIWLLVFALLVLYGGNPSRTDFAAYYFDDTFLGAIIAHDHRSFALFVCDNYLLFSVCRTLDGDIYIGILGHFIKQSKDDPPRKHNNPIEKIFLPEGG